jgi:hypothetical protein
MNVSGFGLYFSEWTAFDVSHSFLFVVDVGSEPEESEEDDENATKSSDIKNSNEEDEEADEESEEEDSEEEENDQAEVASAEPTVPVKRGRGRPRGSTSLSNSQRSTADNSTSNTPLSILEVKALLAANLLLLQGTELGHVISTLEQKCPAALIEEGPPFEFDKFDPKESSFLPSSYYDDHLELNLDVVDEALLRDLYRYSVTQTQGRKRPLGFTLSNHKSTPAAPLASSPTPTGAAVATMVPAITGATTSGGRATKKGRMSSSAAASRGSLEHAATSNSPGVINSGHMDIS